MDYIRRKYEGYESIDTSFLKDELLLGEGEFILIKKEVCAAMDRKICPESISLDLFNNLIELHL